MINIKKFVMDHLPTTNLNMSKYQINKFIIEDQLTSPRKAKQILLELRIRYENIKDYEYDIEIKKLEIKKKENEISNCNDEIDRRIKELELFKLNRQLNALYETYKNISFEIDAFEEYLQKMIETEGIDKVEDYLVNSEKYESGYWINKFIREATMELISTGRISNGLLLAISNMGLDEQKTVYNNVYDQYIKLKMYLDNVNQNKIEEIEKLLLEENKKLEGAKNND